MGDLYDTVLSCHGGIPESTPVLIVGGGPVGLFQALLLSRLGVPSVIIERYTERLGAPKAHALNPRSLEILRQYDLGEKRIRSLGTTRHDGYWVNFITNLCGDQVGRLPYERMDSAVLEDTPEMIHNIPQPILEEEFTKIVEKDQNIILKKGFSIYAVVQEKNEVIATVKDMSNGQFHDIKSRYLIACDGHKSTVRELLKIPSDGEDSDQVMMTIHFNANLRPVVGERVGMLFWIMDPLAAGFIIGYDLSGTQVHISQVDISKQPLNSWTEEMARTKVRAAIGRDVPFDILSFRPWIFRRQIATTFQKGNVFLAGDAAHSFPPTGGLGLNCGLADAHNLAYKMALVHRGIANPSILATYTAERHSIADLYSKQSVKNGKQIFNLVQSLKTEGVEDTVQARHNMIEALRDPGQREIVDKGIEGQREHFDNLELHIGYVYGAKKPPPHASHYQPKLIPGARLPHVWISFQNSDKTAAVPRLPVDVSYVKDLTSSQVSECQWSSLDLCDPDAWTLIVGKQDDKSGTRFLALEKHCDAINIRLILRRLDIDFQIVRQRWFSEAIYHGGLLVRPDQHIMMRVLPTTTEDDLILALDEHLGI